MKLIEREISNLPQETKDEIALLSDKAQDGDAKAFSRLISMFPDISGIWIENTGINNEPVKLSVTQVKSC